MWAANQMYPIDRMEAINRINITQDIAIRTHQTQMCNRDPIFTEEIQDRAGIQIREEMDVDVVEDKAEEEVQDVINTIPENPLVILFHPLEIPKWDVIYYLHKLRELK